MSIFVRPKMPDYDEVPGGRVPDVPRHGPIVSSIKYPSLTDLRHQKESLLLAIIRTLHRKYLQLLWIASGIQPIETGTSKQENLSLKLHSTPTTMSIFRNLHLPSSRKILRKYQKLKMKTKARKFPISNMKSRKFKLKK